MITNHSLNIKNLATGEERNTLYHWHMFPAANLNFAPPEPKLSYEETPANDGALDATESIADRVLYYNRTGEWEFYITNRPNLIANVDETLSWAEIQSDLSNFLHGQKCQISLADDPNYYYVGRLTVTEFNPDRNFQHVTIKYDVEPYKYEFEEYDSGEVSVSSTSTTAAPGSPMAVNPTITVDSSRVQIHPNWDLTRGEAIWMIRNLFVATDTSRINPTISESSFLDVSEDDYYWTAVLWAESYNITSGLTEYIYGGGNTITRAQFLQMLYRANFRANWTASNESYLDGIAYYEGNIPFTDVPINAYYYFAVKWAYCNKIVAGDGEGHFRPNDPITRKHACAILYKYAEVYQQDMTIDDDAVPTFTDLEGLKVIAPWYYVAVVKLYNEGIISGYADGTYKPANYITRGQFVTMLYAGAGKPSVSGVTNPFTDIDSSMYCYRPVLYCYSIGCIAGTSSTTFSPDRPMLRKEMIQVLFRWGNLQAVNNSRLDYYDPDGDEDNDDNAGSGYELASDVPVTAYYYDAVVWGIMHEITTLDKGNMFYPDNKATRAMAAQMLYKLLKILNNWSEDSAATVSPVTDEYYSVSPTWKQGDVDDSTGDLDASDTTSIRTIFMAVESATYGRAKEFAITTTQAYKWKAWFFSYVDSTSQTIITSATTSWKRASGRQETVTIPDNCTHMIFGLSNYSGGTISTDAGNDVIIHRVVEVEGGLSDIVKHTIDYSDAIRWNYYKAIIQNTDHDMCDSAPMTVRLVNGIGTKTTTVEDGEQIVPELVAVDGTNTFTVTGAGTYRIQFKKGSL